MVNTYMDILRAYIVHTHVYITTYIYYYLHIHPLSMDVYDIYICMYVCVCILYIHNTYIIYVHSLFFGNALRFQLPDEMYKRRTSTYCML